MSNQTITVARRNNEDPTFNQVAIEAGSQRIVIRSPHQMDDLIIELLKARRLTWPWPEFTTTEARSIQEKVLAAWQDCVVTGKAISPKARERF